MLSIKNLKSGYGGVEILHGVNIEVKPTEIIAIIGPNGAGKSTILRSIFNLADIQTGKIEFEGKNITRLPAYKLITLGVGYVPQGGQVFLNMTVLENLEMGVFTIKDRQIVKKNIESVLEIFPVLSERIKQNAESLSGGQQQILSVARSLVHDPQLLLLDEPSLGLSPKNAKEIFETIVKIRDTGVAIIIVEQNAKQAVNIANRTYVLEGGKVVLRGGKDILKDKKIKDIYLKM